MDRSWKRIWRACVTTPQAFSLTIEEVEKWLSPNLSYERAAAGMKC